MEVTTCKIQICSFIPGSKVEYIAPTRCPMNSVTVSNTSQERAKSREPCEHVHKSYEVQYRDIQMLTLYKLELVAEDYISTSYNTWGAQGYTEMPLKMKP
jgi:hypothetical protein